MKPMHLISSLILGFAFLGSNFAHADGIYSPEENFDLNLPAVTCEPPLANVLFQQGRSRLEYDQVQFKVGYGQMVEAYRRAGKTPLTVQQLQDQIAQIANTKLSHVFPMGNPPEGITIIIRCSLTISTGCTVEIKY